MTDEFNAMCVCEGVFLCDGYIYIYIGPAAAARHGTHEKTSVIEPMLMTF